VPVRYSKSVIAGKTAPAIASPLTIALRHRDWGALALP